MSLKFWNFWELSFDGLSFDVDGSFEHQAKQEEEGKTLVRWAFRFSPSQAGSDHYVPFIMKGTDLYVQELEKLAAPAPACVLA